MRSPTSKRIPVEAGLHVLRYVRSNGQGMPPAVSVAALGGPSRHLDILAPPLASANEMAGPGGSLVVRAERPSELEVTVLSYGSHSSERLDEVELRLETLETGHYRGSPQASSEVGTVADLHLELVGHVSRRGDVRAGDGWIAGPDAPAPIEGLQLRLVGGPTDLYVSYQVLCGGSQPTWSDWVGNGKFSGSRGQFRSLTGVRFRLEGADAARHELRADALFLGATVQSVKGSEIELVSASQVDPLVGLKVAVMNSISAPEKAPRQSVLPESAANGARTGRVRVFRAAKAQ